MKALINDIASSSFDFDPSTSVQTLREYFYDRVFGVREGPDTLTSEEAALVTIHEGKTKTLAELRRWILDTIDNLVTICVEQLNKRQAQLQRAQYPCE